MSTPEAPPSLEKLLQDLNTLERIVQQWGEDELRTVDALRKSVESLHAEALRRIIRAVKQDSGGAARLREVSGDEVVYAVLRRHGILRPSLQERIEQALAAVRPALAQHGGDVSFVSLELPDTVTVRLTGACDGCPASQVTLTEGVEKAIRDTCPEILHIRTAGAASLPPDVQPVRIVSPFDDTAAWQRLCSREEVPDEAVLAFRNGDYSLLLTAPDGHPRCFENRCGHVGLPLDDGEIEAGVLTCPHHGFRFRLEDGHCLNFPEVQLRSFPVRVERGFVEVLLT